MPSNPQDKYLDVTYHLELTGFELALSAVAIDILFTAVCACDSFEKLVCNQIPEDEEDSDELHKQWHYLYGMMRHLVSTRPDNVSISELTDKLRSLPLQDYLEEEIRG